VMNNPLITKRPMTQHEKIRKIVLGSFFVAIALFLGISKIGFIPLPLPIGAAQFFHIPIILAGIFVGPEVGLLCGIVFGFYAVLTYGSMFPWFVLFPIRPLIGVVSFYVFFGIFRSKHIVLASVVAAICGSLTNSIGVMGLAVIFRVFGPTLQANMAIVYSTIPVILFEAAAAAIIVPLIVVPLRAYLPEVNKK
jgi:uncharacterized membrane protein